jgi:hypothetical protein
MPACKKPVCLEQFECVRQQSTVHLQLKRRSVSNSLVPAGSVSETFMLQEPDLPFVVSAEAEKGSILPIQSSSVCAHRFHLAIHDFQLLLERSPLCMSMRVDALSGGESMFRRFQRRKPIGELRFEIDKLRLAVVHIDKSVLQGRL